MSTNAAIPAHIALTKHHIKVLLVDDQRIVGETVRRMLADVAGLEFQFCADLSFGKRSPSSAIGFRNRRSDHRFLLEIALPDGRKRAVEIPADERPPA